MSISRRRNSSAQSLAAKSLELSWAAPQVVAQRVSRMMAAGASPSARDQQEFMRMGNEKVVAFYESWAAMWGQAMTSYWQTVAKMSFAPMLTPTLQNPFAPFALGSASQKLAKQQMRAVTEVLHAGLSPVHAKAVSNAKRLSRSGSRHS